MYSRPVTNESADQDSESEEIDIRKIFKDIEDLGASNMPWKERKQLENRKVVHLAPHALSVAKPAMKNQKKRELKQQERPVHKESIKDGQ
ncbi:uncharacterized protein LOC121981253 isoform X2 [Zingiber officinale]|uniref:uncharacterized protein LOC121981253 isoform X2 n=1 Tax=Zingiber officinale TaxID=94328 RepID=UPI001C4D73B1|nr:uncharacterized protein LOC121981253 isoform X2 [Zingiber officinale]